MRNNFSYFFIISNSKFFSALFPGIGKNVKIDAFNLQSFFTVVINDSNADLRFFSG